MWFNKDESHYRVCDASGEDPHCSDKYVLVRPCACTCAAHLLPQHLTDSKQRQDTSISDHLHYLGVEFGAAELEGQIAALQMQSLALVDRVPAMEVEATGGEAIVET